MTAPTSSADQTERAAQIELGQQLELHSGRPYPA
jgi:hypothetical protein